MIVCSIETPPQMMVRYNRVDCLSHPVCSAYLHMKWLAYGFVVHSINLLIYVIFLASLTAFVISSENLIRTRRSVMPHASAPVPADDNSSLPSNSTEGGGSGVEPTEASDMYDAHYVESVQVCRRSCTSPICSVDAHVMFSFVFSCLPSKQC